MTVSAETTIRDLSNTRQVLAQLGFGRDEFILTATGAVCLDGALQLAVSHQLYRSQRYGWMMYPHFREAYLGEIDARHSAAQRAIAAVLPGVCADPGHNFAICKVLGQVDPDAQIWHFNDYVCDGGREADTVLEQAIQKLEANL